MSSRLRELTFNEKRKQVGLDDEKFIKSFLGQENFGCLLTNTLH